VACGLARRTYGQRIARALTTRHRAHQWLLKRLRCCHGVLGRPRVICRPPAIRREARERLTLTVVLIRRARMPRPTPGSCADRRCNQRSLGSARATARCRGIRARRLCTSQATRLARSRGRGIVMTRSENQMARFCDVRGRRRSRLRGVLDHADVPRTGDRRTAHERSTSLAGKLLRPAAQAPPVRGLPEVRNYARRTHDLPHFWKELGVGVRRTATNV